MIQKTIFGPNDVNSFFAVDLMNRLSEGLPVDVNFGGDSMLPLIHGDSDTVQLTPVTSQLRCGDIYLFRYKGRLVIHRLLRIHGDDLQKSHFYGTARVKNDGNIDFNGTGTLKVDPIIGFSSYETPSNQGRVSVIPEAELEVTDRWEDSPAFGIYKVTWTVKAGEEEETIESIVFVNPIIAIILLIIVLTIITIWTIIIVRRRKARSSRLAV